MCCSGYLSATHHLPPAIVLPPEESRNRSKSTPPAHYALARRYPDQDRSRRLRWGVFALPLDNRSFAGLVAGVHVFFAWAALTNTREAEEAFGETLARLSVTGVLRGMVGSPLAITLAVAIVAGLVAFTKMPRTHWVLGLGHGLAHLLAVAAVATAAAWVFGGLPSPLDVPGYLLAVGGAGGLLGSLVFAAYLVVADHWACNTNELFAAQRIEGYKNFMRLHLDEHGTLTVYPVGLERVAHAWQPRAGGPEEPWLEPAGPRLEPVLIEEPITLLRGEHGCW